MMTSIITCPGCASQLTVADSAAADSRVQCPQCEHEFSMCETIQLALPAATILPPSPEPVACEPEVAEESTSDSLSPDAPLASWEARIKNAIAGAMDPEADTEPSSFEAFESPTVEVEEKEKTAPKIELNRPWENEIPSIDPPGEEEPATESFVPTLSFSPSNLEQEQVEAPTNLDQKAHLEQEVVEESPGIAVAAKPSRRLLSRALSKMVVVPVLTLGLGFYVLIWMLGPQADYLGLANLLPASILPAHETDESIDDALPLAEADPIVDEDPQSLSSPAENPTIVDSSVVQTTLLQPQTMRALPPSVSAAEFTELVDIAETALPGFVSGSAQDQAVLQQKAQSYMSLCRLAEKFDFIHQLGLSPQATGQIQRGKEIFQRITTDPSLLEDLSRVAALWWDYGERSNQGIFITGRIERVVDSQSGKLCLVSLPGNGRVVPVLLKHSAFQRGETIAVVGRIESSSTVLLSNTAGVPPQIVTSLFSYSLPAS